MALYFSTLADYEKWRRQRRRRRIQHRNMLPVGQRITGGLGSDYFKVDFINDSGARTIAGETFTRSSVGFSMEGGVLVEKSANQPRNGFYEDGTGMNQTEVVLHGGRFRETERTNNIWPSNPTAGTWSGTRANIVASGVASPRGTTSDAGQILFGAQFQTAIRASGNGFTNNASLGLGFWALNDATFPVTSMFVAANGGVGLGAWTIDFTAIGSNAATDWEWLTADHPAVTETVPMQASGTGTFTLAFTNNTAGICSPHIWGVQLEEGASVVSGDVKSTSTILTTTTSETRTAESWTYAETWPRSGTLLTHEWHPDTVLLARAEVGVNMPMLGLNSSGGGMCAGYNASLVKLSVGGSPKVNYHIGSFPLGEHKFAAFWDADTTEIRCAKDGTLNSGVVSYTEGQIGGGSDPINSGESFTNGKGVGMPGIVFYQQVWEEPQTPAEISALTTL